MNAIRRWDYRDGFIAFWIHDGQLCRRNSRDSRLLEFIPYRLVAKNFDWRAYEQNWS